jgi:hypothetical protein
MAVQVNDWCCPDFDVLVREASSWTGPQHTPTSAQQLLHLAQCLASEWSGKYREAMKAQVVNPHDKSQPTAATADKAATLQSHEAAALQGDNAAAIKSGKVAVIDISEEAAAGVGKAAALHGDNSWRALHWMPMDRESEPESVPSSFALALTTSHWLPSARERLLLMPGDLFCRTAPFARYFLDKVAHRQDVTLAASSTTNKTCPHA